MKNKIFEQDKPFFLGYLVFGTFLKRWPDRLKVLQKRKEESPVIANEIDAAIQTTEESMKKFKEAAEKYKAAAKEAKEEYDNAFGLKGKVRGFFGLEQGDAKSTDMFVLDNQKFRAPDMSADYYNRPTLKETGDFSMEDILSPDFNIGLFLVPPLEGVPLKKEVMGNMLAFRKYYDPKTSSKISNEEIENLQDETLDTFDPFKVFSPTQQESLIKELEEPIGVMMEVKNACKPKAQQAFAKFQQSMKSNPTKVNLTKQSKLLINNPYYAIYRNFEGYDTGKKQIVGKFPDLLKKVLIKIHDKLYTEPFDNNLQKALSEIVAKFVDGDFKNFDGGDESIGDYLFRTPTKAKQASNARADKEEANKLRKRFEPAVEKRIKELQKGIPMFIAGAEEELSGFKEAAKLDPVYAGQDSLVTNFKDKNAITKKVFDFAMAYSNTSTITDKQYKTIVGDQGNALANMETYLETLDDLIKARNEEARRDLTALAAFLATQEKKAQASARIINTTIKKNNNETILALYKKWHDWMGKNKTSLLKYFEPPSPDQNLQEQIIKLIKPYLHERIKSKRIGATK